VAYIFDVHHITNGERGAARRNLLDLKAEPQQEPIAKWVQVLASANWSRRFAHVTVVQHDGSFVLAGGTEMDYAVRSHDGSYDYTQHKYLNDIWKSGDNGSSWSLVPTRSDRWVPRRGHAAAMEPHGQVMFIFGGLCGSGCYLNDVWSAQRVDVWSSHGRAPWAARHGHVVLPLRSINGFILLGGHDGKDFMNDVWTIESPTTNLQWEHLGHAAFQPRYGHAGVEYEGTALVLGGLLKNGLTVACRGDVWKTTDGGRNWLQLDREGFPPRYQHVAGVVHGSLWVVGGVDTDLQRLNDVWRSTVRDGELGQVWEELRPAAPWPPRYEFSAVVLGSRLYIFGGMNDRDNRYNDIWMLVRTCADNVHCPGGTTCKDVDNEAECVDVCLHACPDDTKCIHDKNFEAQCIDPCESYQCPRDHKCFVENHQPQCKRALPTD
jgi:hypothetical protein